MQRCGYDDKFWTVSLLFHIECVTEEQNGHSFSVLCNDKNGSMYLKVKAAVTTDHDACGIAFSSNCHNFTCYIIQYWIVSALPLMK